MEGISGSSTASDEITTERVKQICLDLFHSIYIKRDMNAILENVEKDVCWVGEKPHFVARNKEELRTFMEKEIEGISSGGTITVLHLDAVRIEENVYSVTGGVQIHKVAHSDASCCTCQFMMGVTCRDGHILIKSAHIFMSGEPQKVKKTPEFVADIKEESDNYDKLTGLYNLDFFKGVVHSYLGKETPATSTYRYALFCTDIENFEKLNNVYGFQEGNNVLIELGATLIKFDPKVIYCCRSVADHFLVLYKYENEKRIRRELSALCKRFDENVGKRYKEAGLKLGVGVYLIQDYTINVDKMVDYANHARKNLRHILHGRVAFCDSKVFAGFEKVKKIECLMEKALLDGEFKVYIQPKYDLVTEKIMGAEALVRWVRQDGSMIYPDEFIPIFEKNGFIQELDFYMLEQVCKLIQRRLKEKKICVPISVNQSRYLLKNLRYPDRIAKTLSKYNTPPELIELELTERLFSDRLVEMAQIMKRLKKIGIRWSIDDFGTGYSSLNLLKELPVDIIKIDKAFLDETETSEVSRIIIRKTVELTRELDKTVVCEGVETVEQAKYLRKISCDVAQGYLYARPMPMSEFESLLDKGEQGKIV